MSELTRRRILTSTTSSGDSDHQCIFEVKWPNGSDLNFGANYIKKVNWPSGVTQIAPYAFVDNRMFTEFDIPSTVTTIGDYAFARTRIQNVVIPEGVTTIGKRAFSAELVANEREANIVSVQLPSSLRSLGTNAFQYQKSLKTFNIPSGIGKIPNACFSYCCFLSSTKGAVIDIPEGITEIGLDAFEMTYYVSKVTLPSTLTKIGSYAFYYCGYNSSSSSNVLTTLVIPSGVTSIGTGTFSYMKTLTEITVQATTPPTLGSNAFNNTNNAPIYVPVESVDAYKTATNWSSYASRIQAIPS